MSMNMRLMVILILFTASFKMRLFEEKLDFDHSRLGIFMHALNWNIIIFNNNRSDNKIMKKAFPR